MKRLFLTAVVVVLCACVGMGVSAAYDGHDFCLGDVRAERTACTAVFYDQLSGCLDWLNFDLWVADHPEDAEQSINDSATARADFLACKAEALEAKAACRADLDTCLED